MYFLFVTFVLLQSSVTLVKSDCNVVSKKEWGGLMPVHVEYLPRPVDLVIIQHTVTNSCETDEQCADILKRIQTTHMELLDHWDIGPSFLVGGNGKVYEGSGWLHAGAHTHKYNRKSIGIAFIGNFNSQQPKPEALQAVKDLIRCGVSNGHLTSNYYVIGQRQVYAITSPGSNLYDLIIKWPDWLEDVSAIRIYS